MNKMFCFQCEQTSASKACTGNQGVCGKHADTSNLQDELCGALVSLARAVEGTKPDAINNRLMLEGLFTTITNVNFDNEAVQIMIDLVHAEIGRVNPKQLVEPDYDMSLLWAVERRYPLTEIIDLFGSRVMAAYAYHA
jgi:hydroxylamine reductase